MVAKAPQGHFSHHLTSGEGCDTLVRHGSTKARERFWTTGETTKEWYKVVITSWSVKVARHPVTVLERVRFPSGGQTSGGTHLEDDGTEPLETGFLTYIRRLFRNPTKGRLAEGR